MANIVKKITGFNGEIVFDEGKPDGTPRKLLNVDKINKMGWQASVDLETGLTLTYAEFSEKYLEYIKIKGHKILSFSNV
jgi:GDP-L-fucose synthase